MNIIILLPVNYMFITLYHCENIPYYYYYNFDETTDSIHFGNMLFGQLMILKKFLYSLLNPACDMNKLSSVSNVRVSSKFFSGNFL